MLDLNKIFTQSGNILVINYRNNQIKFVMPDYFDINDVSVDLKMLSLFVLFHPIDFHLMSNFLNNYEFTRKSAGKKIGLAFSGGVDSVAASALLPQDDMVLFHHKRIITTQTMYKHDNPMHVIKHHPKDVLIIESDLEDVRLSQGKMAGFLNDHSFFGGFILLVDYLNIGYLSNGMMLESTYLMKGYEFRDFHNSSYYNSWFKFFEKANLPLFSPCIPCSEILTNKIVEANGLVAQSCIRGVKGEGCNKCYKCFRKKLINGVLLPYGANSEPMKLMSNRPLKQGGSLIYAMNKHGFNIPELKEYRNLKLNWLEGYFEYTLQSIPTEFREHLRTELNKYAQPIMDEQKLRDFKL